jgi:hypothetical protein
VGGSFGAEKRKEIPHGLKSTPKITPKIKISDPNKNTKNTPNSDFFKGIPTWFLHRGGLRPPSLFLISTRI